jgi:hypothetical protein
MKIAILVSCFAFALTFSAAAQTGFFLIIEEEKCEHAVVSLDEKQKYCITEEPIIGTSEFKVEGDLQVETSTKNYFFNIRFTKNGFEKLKVICANMPEKKLVFVVKGKVAGAYDNKKLKPRQVIQIIGDTDSKSVSWFFENVKTSN